MSSEATQTVNINYRHFRRFPYGALYGNSTPPMNPAAGMGGAVARGSRDFISLLSSVFSDNYGERLKLDFSRSTPKDDRLLGAALGECFNNSMVTVNDVVPAGDYTGIRINGRIYPAGHIDGVDLVLSLLKAGSESPNGNRDLETAVRRLAESGRIKVQGKDVIIMVLPS